MRKDYIEVFLSNIESNEEYIFNFCQDHFLFPILPFFQLAYIINTEEVMKELTSIESEFDSMMVRIDGYLTVVISEKNYQEIVLRNRVTQVLKMMRF